MKRQGWLRLATLVALLGAASGCEDDGITCTAIAVSGVEASYPANEEDRCDGQLQAIGDGGYTETLECFDHYPKVAPLSGDGGTGWDGGIDGMSGDRGRCLCYGLVERAGHFTIRLTLGGEVVEEQAITVKQDGCHVATENIEFSR